MEKQNSAILKGFYIDALKIFPMRGLVVKPDGDTEHLEPKVMDVLVCLASQANILVSREELLLTVWPGRVAADSQLTRAISELRRKLQDDQSSQALIETIPKRGYRLLGAVVLGPDIGTPNSLRPKADGIGSQLIHVGGLFLVAAIIIGLLLLVSEALMDGDSEPRGNPGDTANLSIAEVSTTDELAFRHYLEGMQGKQVKTNKALRLAELAFREALARDPDFFEAKLELGFVYWELQRVGEISQTEASELVHPILEQLHRRAADNGLVLALDTFIRYPDIVDVDTREEELIAAIAHTPTEPRLHRNLARLLAANGRDEDALEWLERGLQGAPDDWELHAARGRLLLRNGQYELAGASIRTALILNPSDPTLLGNAAKIALLQGDYVSWYSAWLRAMEIAPHDDEIPAYIALQLYTLGLHDEADEFLNRAYDVQPRRSWSQVPFLYRHLITGDSEAAHNLSMDMLIEGQENRWGAATIALTVYVSTALELGQTESALQLLEQLSPGVIDEEFDPQSPTEARYRQSALLLGASQNARTAVQSDLHPGTDRTDLDIALAIALGENDSAVRGTLDSLSTGLAINGYNLPYKRFRYLEILKPVVSEPRVASRLNDIDQQAARAADEIQAFMRQ